MKIWLFSFSGHYLSGEGVVWSKSKKTAIKKAKEAVERTGCVLTDEDINDSMVEIDTSKPDVHIISNGDY
jgi:hypothetical protein